jgi:hypothetical protein
MFRLEKSHHKAEAFQLMQLFSNKYMYYILLLYEYNVFYEPDKLSSSLYGNGGIYLKVAIHFHLVRKLKKL